MTGMDPISRAVAISVVVALGVAALLPDLRAPLLLVLLAFVVLAPRDAAWRWAVAGAVPVALIMAWGGLIGERLVPEVIDCADPFSAKAWERVVEAVLVIAAVALLARLLGTRVADLGLRRPTRLEVGLGIVAIVIIPIPALYIGSILAEPFFGPMDLDLSDPRTAVPAFALAIANGTMEELAYRGALMSWLSRAAGPFVGLVGQAIDLRPGAHRFRLHRPGAAGRARYRRRRTAGRAHRASDRFALVRHRRAHRVRRAALLRGGMQARRRLTA